ncbi:NADP:D-xylose dehydrogenase [Ascobolus immersus RN42]|uniref:D-xylose 1-dehydrogenase (NADP(+), D-xylono-1,5-lactone-forming) n=1 Tax=Ascobolus immersus RN42 TaxID=1160509 RepID=A0A3N4I6Q7_ASCIM|nr:NADP:D-xylose dehydrogenase [Ascobolus immersus RN42]
MATQEPFTLRWGILATGWIASVFAKDLLTSTSAPGRNATDVRHIIQAVGASSSQQKATDFIKKIGAPESTTAYGSYDELVNDPNVDIIYVATPHSHHFAHTLLALNAGKHVLCEKPFTVNAAQTKILIEKAREKGVFMMEAVWTRFFPLSYEIRKLVQDGTIGEVRRVWSDLSLAQNPEETYGPGDEHRMVNRDLAGGALLDIGVYSLLWIWQTLYHLDPARPKPEVSASVQKYRTGVDAEATVLLHFPTSTGIASTSLRIDTDPNNTGLPCARIQGTKGEIQISHPAYKPESYTIVIKGEEEKRVEKKIEGQHGMAWEADECARCIRDGKKESEVMGLEESLAMMEVLDRVREIGGVKYPDSIETTQV